MSNMSGAQKFSQSTLNQKRVYAGQDLDRRILKALRFRQGLTATQIAPHVHASTGVVSKHLYKLRATGRVVKAGMDGRKVIWRTSMARMEDSATPSRPVREWRPLNGYDLYAHQRLAELTRK